MAKKPTTKKEVAVKATSSDTVKATNGIVYTVKLGKNSKFGSRVNAKSK